MKKNRSRSSVARYSEVTSHAKWQTPRGSCSRTPALTCGGGGGGPCKGPQHRSRTTNTLPGKGRSCDRPVRVGGHGCGSDRSRGLRIRKRDGAGAQGALPKARWPGAETEHPGLRTPRAQNSGSPRRVRGHPRSPLPRSAPPSSVTGGREAGKRRGAGP